MAAPPGHVPGMPPPNQLTEAQRQMMEAMRAEATRRGMTLEQFQEWNRQQIIQGAKEAGMTPEQFIKMKQAEHVENMRRAQQAQQAQAQGQGQGQPPQAQPQGPPGPPGQQMQQIDITKPVEAKPDALAVAKFLRNQNLKTRTVLFRGQRRDMFKVKRALRALQTDKYKKAQKKDALLPVIENEAQARSALQLLPISMLALRVAKKDAHEGHDHPKPKKDPKRVKGQWDVEVVHQQLFEPMMHYMWVYEGPQWKTKVWAAGLAVLAFAVVLFPLWPIMLRQGVWYLSMGAMGLLVAFLGLGVVRLILFLLTVLTIPPGLWIYPNLFEDVGFFDSFRPMYQWGDTKKVKKSKKAAIAAAPADGASGDGKETAAAPAAAPAPTTNGTAAPTTNGTAVSSSAQPTAGPTAVSKRQATVEEAEDE